MKSFDPRLRRPTSHEPNRFQNWSGYHHIDIYNDHQEILGVAWPFCGKLRFFSFKVLFFGLSSACFCFTKLLRPLFKRWRSMSRCCFGFLDGISGHSERVSASAATLLYQKDLLYQKRLSVACHKAVSLARCYLMSSSTTYFSTSNL